MVEYLWLLLRSYSILWIQAVAPINTRALPSTNIEEVPLKQETILSRSTITNHLSRSKRHQMSKQTPAVVAAEQSAVAQLLAHDTTPWYKKTNLRFLYLCLVPAALGVEMTTGYDGSVLNGLQAVNAWQERE